MEVGKLPIEAGFDFAMCADQTTLLKMGGVDGGLLFADALTEFGLECVVNGEEVAMLILGAFEICALVVHLLAEVGEGGFVAGYELIALSLKLVDGGLFMAQFLMIFGFEGGTIGLESGVFVV